MDRRQLRAALPFVYAIAIVIAALTVGGTTLTIVAVVGALLLGLFYAVGGHQEGETERDRARRERRGR
jgi:predicted exporter